MRIIFNDFTPCKFSNEFLINFINIYNLMEKMEIALRLCEISLKDGQRKGRKMELRFGNEKGTQVLIGNGNLMKALKKEGSFPI